MWAVQIIIFQIIAAFVFSVAIYFAWRLAHRGKKPW